MTGSRTQKSFLNMQVNTICYFASLFLSFFTRKVFLEGLGREFLGLLSTFQSLMGFLDIAEMGVGATIGFVLYKPIYENDRKSILEILSIMGFIYRWIGSFVLLAGLILSAFFPAFFSKTDISLAVIYFGFYASLAATILGYFINYNTTLLLADQKNYVLTGVSQGITISRVLLQAILVLTWGNFYLFFAIELLFALLQCALLQGRMRKHYPWLKTDLSQGKGLLKSYPIILRYIRQWSVHKISIFVQGSTLPLIIYSLSSLSVVTLYTNYTAISQRIQGFLCNLASSTSASVGNLVAEGNPGKTYGVYRQMFSLLFFTGGVLTFCLYALMDDFVIAWLGREYLLDRPIVFLICLNFFLSTIRGITDQFNCAFGLLSDVWAAVAEAVIFLAVSLPLGYFYGLGGILMGPVVSLIVIIHLWKPYFLFSRGLKQHYGKYWLLFLQNALTLALPTAATLFLLSRLPPGSLLPNPWLSWLLKATLFTATETLLAFLAFYTLLPDFRLAFQRFLHRLPLLRQ